MSSVANKFYRIVDAYGIEQAAIKGQAWYPEAWNHCLNVSKEYGVSAQRVAAVLAVTSPVLGGVRMLRLLIVLLLIRLFLIICDSRRMVSLVLMLVRVLR